MADRPLVIVVDDDETVRNSLPDLLKVLGYAARAYPSATAFLQSADLEKPRCLILDVSMPGMTGPELRQELVRRGRQVPVIFITAYREDAVRSQMLAQGAVDCLLKPFSEADLVGALAAAFARP